MLHKCRDGHPDEVDGECSEVYMDDSRGILILLLRPHAHVDRRQRSPSGGRL